MLARRPVALSPAVALRRPLLVAVVSGVALSIAATGRVTPGLVLGTTLTWSYWVVAQIAVAIVLMRADAARTVGLARAFDLFFAAHAPWSLAVLAIAAWGPAPFGRPFWPLWPVIIAAPVLTIRAINAFFREVLELDPRAARRRTLAHQVLTCLLLLAYVWMTSSITPRLLKLFAEW